MTTHTPEWFEYDWPIEGRKARFSVDTALNNLPLDKGYTFLLTLSCESQSVDRDKRDSLTPREKRHSAALLKKSESLFKSYYAGSVELNDSITFVFYVADEECQQQLTNAVSREKVLFCTTKCMREPDLKTYFSFLYPDRAKRWTEQNRKRVEFMRKNGDAISPLRRVSFLSYFPNEHLAMDFSESARQLGFAKGDPVFSPEQELPYGVVVYKISSIKKLEIDMLTTKLVRCAEKFGGEFSYWESQIVRQTSPFMR